MNSSQETNVGRDFIGEIKDQANVVTGQSAQVGKQSRLVQMGRDAYGNLIISGDNNRVTIEVSSHKSSLQQEIQAACPIGPNPYKGLEAFDEEDANRFFGREELTNKLWKTFRMFHDFQPGDAVPARVLPILGPSGSGKSSLARAGLIPELARRPLPGLQTPRCAVFTPGDHPLEALAKILARIATHAPAPAAKTREFAEELQLAHERQEDDGLRRIAGVLPDIEFSPLIVLVDQFEEVYSLCDDTDERDAFANTLLHAAAAKAGYVSVILTLRSDFLGQIQQHPALNQIVANQGVIVSAMSQDELYTAIAEPAKTAGHELDRSTIDLLIEQTEGREGVLPLLQFALTRIWEGIAEGVNPAETLNKIGGVGGALAGEAQRLYERLNKHDQMIARRAFLALVRLGEGTRDARRRLSIAEIVAHQEDSQHVHEVMQFFS